MDSLNEVVFHISEKSALSDFLFRNYRFNPEINWFHVVYWELGGEYRILHLRASSSDDLKIPRMDFNSRLNSLPEISENELSFLLGTYGRFVNPLPCNPKIDYEFLSEEIKKIIFPTKGYLLFKEQAMEFYSHLTGEDAGHSLRWVENWNKRKRKVRENHLFIDAMGKEIDLMSFFPEEEMGDVFLNQPISETYFLLKQLHEDFQDQTSVEGKFKAEYLGDLFYEEDREKETVEGIAHLIETKNGLVRLKLLADFPKLGIRETWEVGLNYPYKSYPWLDYIGFEIIELGDHDCLIQLNPFREVLGEDYYDDFYLSILIKSDLILGYCFNYFLNFKKNLNVMEWELVQKAFLEISKGTDLNTKNSSYRVVLENPPYICKKYGYNSIGFKVQIGENQYIDIPLKMLNTIYDYSIKMGGIYNSKVFRNLFPKQASGHGCHIHVVGQLFVKAGVAVQKDGDYKLN